MSSLYNNHAFLSEVLIHNKLPLIQTNEFDFYRCIPFEEKFYGLTVSELHKGNLRQSSQSRYASLFPGEKLSYWADSIVTARSEIKKHGSNKDILSFWAYDDSTSTFPTLTQAKNENLTIIDGVTLHFSEILDKVDSGIDLDADDELILKQISNEKPDCLAYKSNVNSDSINFIFFEKGFRKLSIREVRLRLGERPSKSSNRIVCSTSSDYSSIVKNYGNAFQSVCKIRFDNTYLESKEYLFRKTNKDFHLKAIHDSYNRF